MASKTTNPKIKIGTKIEGISETLTVVKILKHAYIVKAPNSLPFDLWSFQVFQNAHGIFCTNITK